MRHLPVLFSLSLFGSALLSFSVQPILGKMLLPMVGGAPAGWIVALAFFQLSLLAGYGVSYFLGRFSPWVHALGLLALYVAGICYLPPTLPVISSDMQGADLSFAVTKALFATIFIPFLALTATTAALQRVFAASKHKTASDPYYLFVASNIGSFVGLLAYPFLLEPFVGISEQTHWWRVIYFAVMALIVMSTTLAFTHRQQNQKTPKIAKSSKIEAKQIMMWIALSFIPCSLSMGVTTLITTDFGSFPLFWIIPLALYLLTFVLAFVGKKLLSDADLSFWQQVAVALFFIMLLASIKNNMWDQSLIVFAIKSVIMLAVFFISAWACHQRLAGMRPPVGRLPQFYFIVALGGGLAGILHAFVIPYVLTSVYEFHIAVILSLLLNAQWAKKITKFKLGRLRNVYDWLAGAAVILLVLIGLTIDSEKFTFLNGLLTAIFLFIFLLFALQPKKLFVLCIGVFVLIAVASNFKGILLQERNFFGVYRVVESLDKKTGNTLKLFMHGNTWHGMAVLDKNGKSINENVGYYVHKGPIADVLDIAHAKDFAVAGLGTGQLACFNKKLKIDFFEIDPDIVPIAEKHFPYLKDCKPRHIYIGDGRIELVKQKSSYYDVVLMDAFTSDGVPTHLLTADALEEYKSRLRPNGIVLFHISNRYFKLAPPIAAIADQLGLKAYRKIYKLPKERLYEFQSDWVAVPLNAQQGKALEQKGWEKVAPATTPWTDDKSSLISALSLTF